MKPKPTRSAAPRLLPNGQPDQSNIICSEATSRLIAAAIARGLPAFARRYWFREGCAASSTAQMTCGDSWAG